MKCLLRFMMFPHLMYLASLARYCWWVPCNLILVCLMFHALMDGIQSLQLPPERYLSGIKFKFKISCALIHQVEENKKKLRLPPSKSPVDLPSAHFGILKLLNKFLTYYPQQKRHRHPNGKKGEENDTPVAKVASKGIKTLVETTPKNFQEA